MTASYNYTLRGHRVPSKTPEQIGQVAASVCRALELSGNNFKKGKIGLLFNTLEEYGINLDPINDEQWIDIASAMVDPATGIIHMPNSLYVELNEAKPRAVRIFLHELGHLFLAHKPNLHFASNDSVQLYEDSEWQADCFADSVISRLRLPLGGKQLEFRF